MSLDAIVDLARHVNPATEVRDVMPLHGGFSSQAYKVTTAQPFVLLVARANGVSTTNYGHAYTVLTLLERRGFHHAPQPLWLKRDHTALAISFFDGMAADAFDFSHHLVDPLHLATRIIDNLLDTAVISFEEYEKTAREFNVTPLPIETPTETACKYGTQWFAVVKASCPDPEIVAWLEPRIEHTVQAVSAMRCDNPRFSHGDPSNPNILIRNDGSFMLIDWDSARFHCSWADYLVAYTTNLVDFMKPYRDELITHVAARLSMPRDVFAEQVYEYRRNVEIFDVNWAAMMMAKVAKGEASGTVDHFRDIALSRIQAYEASFGSHRFA